MNKEESPYCEICGHCGDIGCCGIINFVENHIKGKTNCKNEDSVIKEIIDICEYETEIFKENELLEKQNLELKNDLITLFNLICDDDTEFEFFREIFCRKLEKNGIVKKVDGYYEVEKRNNIGGE